MVFIANRIISNIILYHIAIHIHSHIELVLQPRDDFVSSPDITIDSCTFTLIPVHIRFCHRISAVCTITGTSKTCRMTIVINRQCRRPLLSTQYFTIAPIVQVTVDRYGFSQLQLSLCKIRDELYTVILVIFTNEHRLVCRVSGIDTKISLIRPTANSKIMLLIKSRTL